MAMKVMSFNIWSDAPRNSRWAARRDVIAGVMRAHQPDLIGLQEATLPMIRDLCERLPEYDWLGHGRDDGKESGEHTPVFYRRERFERLAGGSFWLAESCDLPGRGWDARCHRTVTWVRLHDREANAPVLHFNTHLDHLGRLARMKGAELLLHKVTELGGRDPVVVSGDFNCREASAPYRLLTGSLPLQGEQGKVERLRDALHESESPPEGPRKTYRGLLGLLGLGRIDYIFIKNALRVRRHRVLEEGAGASDHRAVMVELLRGASVV